MYNQKNILNNIIQLMLKLNI